jgi:hypothetical protein
MHQSQAAQVGIAPIADAHLVNAMIRILDEGWYVSMSLSIPKSTVTQVLADHRTAAGTTPMVHDLCGRLRGELCSVQVCNPTPPYNGDIHLKAAKCVDNEIKGLMQCSGLGKQSCNYSQLTKLWI